MGCFGLIKKFSAVRFTTKCGEERRRRRIRCTECNEAAERLYGGSCIAGHAARWKSDNASRSILSHTQEETHQAFALRSAILMGLSISSVYERVNGLSQAY